MIGWWRPVRHAASLSCCSVPGSVPGRTGSGAIGAGCRLSPCRAQAELDFKAGEPQPSHLEDGGRLQHLGHEGGHAPHLAVAGADSGEDAVAHRDARGFARQPTPNLRHEHVHAHLRRRTSVFWGKQKTAHQAVESTGCQHLGFMRPALSAAGCGLPGGIGSVSDTGPKRSMQHDTMNVPMIAAGFGRPWREAHASPRRQKCPGGGAGAADMFTWRM